MIKYLGKNLKEMTLFNNHIFRRAAITCAWAILAVRAWSQIVPDNSTGPAANPVTPPVAYTSPVTNYICTWEPSMPAADPAAVLNNAGDVRAVKTSTQYQDGLGRPLQTVNKGISPAGKDLVAPVVYDPFGRERYGYLPYASSGSDGRFKTNPFGEQAAFMKAAYPGEQVYYSETAYEASPLNRVLRSYAPGNSWASTGGNKPLKQAFEVNTTADAVVIWDIAISRVVPAAKGAYPAGRLHKLVSTDEHGHRTVEFRDKQDRTVLRKVEISTGAADGHTGWLCTYYVYDDLGRLRFVLPPKAVEAVKHNWTIPGQVADGLCFQYQYDGRDRQVAARIPGTDWPLETVYDQRDRPVFTRDGALKDSGRWQVTFYDPLNRPTMTALYQSAASRQELQTAMDRATGGSQEISQTFPGTTNLEAGTHDGRARYEATESITFEDGFDSSNSGEFEAVINPSLTGGSTTITATNPLPGLDPSLLTPLSYTYYNSYNYAGAHPPLTGDLGKPLAGSNPYAEPVKAVSSKVLHQVTGTKLRVLGTEQWLTTTSYYDDKGRVIQAIRDNGSGGQEVTTTLYDFSGKVLSTYQRHTNPRSGLTPATRVLTMMSYDHAGRLLTISKQLNDNGVNKVIVRNTYDEAGQLKTKVLGNSLETLEYAYNIRGWLKGINKDFAKNGTGGHYFGMELHYDYGYTQARYNGDIAGITWRGASDKAYRSYGFGYDPANRLLKADFTQYTNGGWNTSAGVNYSVKMGDGSTPASAYDPNGNILAMTQLGLKGSASATIDQLTYHYLPNSNKLQGVTDAVNDPQSTLGDFKEVNGSGSDDYRYDASGSMISDNNKNISSIRYNHLHLPQEIVFKDKSTVSYLYDAAGKRLQKMVTDQTVSPRRVTTIDYLDGFVYCNDTLQFLGHEQGRIRTVFKTGQPVAYVYDYFVKDHLGSVRQVLTEQTDFSMYAATMETERSAAESALFSNVEETRSAKPVGYPQDQTSDKNEFVAKLNAKDGGKKIGPSLVLRVMAGDTIQVGARAFYKSTGPKDNRSVTPEDMVASLLQAFGGENTGNGSHAARQAEQLSPFRSMTSSAYQRLKEKDLDNTNSQDKPRAYLNFVLFDDQFNLVEENSGVRQVKATPDELQTLAADKMPVTKSGFLYVYTSNETTQDVFFDNVVLSVAQGPLLEETHYYPLGLTMAGISTNALVGTNYPANRLKYNGKELQSKEFSDGSGLEWYDYGFREYDHQTGRFFRVDPLAEDFYYLTPYQYASNNPATNIDLDGLEGMHFQEVFNYLVKGTVQNPNGTEAKVLGTISGVGGSIHGVGKGLVNTVAHPVEAAKGIYRMMSQTPAENAVDYGLNVISNYTGAGSDAFTEYAIGAHVLTDIGMALAPLKGSTGLKIGKGAATEGVVIGESVAAKGGVARLAANWQGKGLYPGIDNWRNITLGDGKFVVGGLPGQSNYYTTLSGLQRSGLNKTTLFEGLQVAKHPQFGYRGQVGIYRVTGNTPAAFGTTYANPQLGTGGLPQIFVPDYSGLQLIKTVHLK